MSAQDAEVVERFTKGASVASFVVRVFTGKSTKPTEEMIAEERRIVEDVLRAELRRLRAVEAAHGRMKAKAQDQIDAQDKEHDSDYRACSVCHAGFIAARILAAGGE